MVSSLGKSSLLPSLWLIKQRLPSLLLNPKLISENETGWSDILTSLCALSTEPKKKKNTPDIHAAFPLLRSAIQTLKEFVYLHQELCPAWVWGENTHWHLENMSHDSLRKIFPRIRERWTSPELTAHPLFQKVHCILFLGIWFACSFPITRCLFYLKDKLTSY